MNMITPKRYTLCPEDNTFVLLLLILFSLGTYYFRWLVRVSRLFNDNPATNILLVIFTAGIWGFYLNLRYMEKSEKLNRRESGWYTLFLGFIFPLPILIVQNNINEYFVSLN